MYVLCVCRDLVGGRSRHAVLKGETVPEVDTIEPWDGKDGEVRSSHVRHLAIPILGYQILLSQ